MTKWLKIILGRAALIVLIALCGYQYRLLEQRLTPPAEDQPAEPPLLTLAPHALLETLPAPLSFDDFLHSGIDAEPQELLTPESDSAIDSLPEHRPYVMRFPVSGSLSNVKFFKKDDALKVFGLNQQRFYTSTDEHKETMLIRIQPFTQTIPLPADADIDQLAHRMEDGHLVIEIPRLLHAPDDLYERNFI